MAVTFAQVEEAQDAEVEARKVLAEVRARVDDVSAGDAAREAAARQYRVVLVDWSAAERRAEELEEAFGRGQ